MDYILYTTEGYTELPEGKPIENCQIIDFIYGTTESTVDLKEKYAKEMALDSDDMSIFPIIKKETLEAISKVVNYLWKDEQSKYEETDDKNHDSHIFQTLKQIADDLDLQIKK